MEKYMFIDQKSQYHQDINSSKTDQQIQNNPNTNTISILQKLAGKGPGTAKTTLKTKSKVGGLALPDMRKESEKELIYVNA